METITFQVQQMKEDSDEGWDTTDMDSWDPIYDKTAIDQIRRNFADPWYFNGEVEAELIKRDAFSVYIQLKGVPNLEHSESVDDWKILIAYMVSDKICFDDRLYVYVTDKTSTRF